MYYYFLENAAARNLSAFFGLLTAYIIFVAFQINMFNLVLFGPPGSGKGTQSEKIVSRYGLVHLSTGNLLREEIASNSSLGLAARNYMDHGQLVPDEVVIGMVDSFFDRHKDAAGFLFDGFPRTQAQAEALDELLKRKKTSIHAVIALEVTEDELVKRLLNRGKTSGRSDDTNEEVIRKRFSVYMKETSPVADHYKEQKKFFSIPGEGTVEEIFGNICAVMDAKK